MLKSWDGTNLNALEFRNFLINRSIRDLVQSVIFILNISCCARSTMRNKVHQAYFFFNSNFGNVSFVIATEDNSTGRKKKSVKIRLFDTYFCRHLLPQNYLSGLKSLPISVGHPPLGPK